MINSSPAIHQIHEATLELLETTGVRFGSSTAVELLAASGVKVNRAQQRVFPTWAHIGAALDTAPRVIRIYGREASYSLALGKDRSFILSGGGSLRVHTLKREFAPSTWEHLHQFNILLNALPHVHMCINQVDPLEDQGERVYYRRVAAEMLIGMPKPLCLQVLTPADVQAAAEMGRVIRGSSQALADRLLFIVGANSEPPLHVPTEVADLVILASRQGIPCSVGNYSMLGLTAPVTIAGAVVQLNAVQLASLLLSQIVQPSAPFLYTVFCGSSNLRTLEVVTANPAAARFQMLATRLGREYGLPVYGATMTDAHLPDQQAACERATQIVMAMDAGMSLIQGPTSMMDQSMLSSFAQAVIDNDIIDYITECRMQPAVNNDTLALGVAHEVVNDQAYHDLQYASHSHTVQHLSESIWTPGTFAQDSFASWQRLGSRTVLERAEDVARRIIAEHVPEPMDATMAVEIRAIARD